VNGAGEFVFQEGLNLPVTLDAGQALERGADDNQTEMGFAFGPGTDVSLVQVGFIDHVELRRLQRPGEFGFNFLFDCHGTAFVVRSDAVSFLCIRIAGGLMPKIA